MSHSKKKLQTLSEHIKEEYGGNQSECARAYGVERNQVKQWLGAVKPVCVLDDGRLITVIREPMN